MLTEAVLPLPPHERGNHIITVIFQRQSLLGELSAGSSLARTRRIGEVRLKVLASIDALTKRVAQIDPDLARGKTAYDHICHFRWLLTEWSERAASHKGDSLASLRLLQRQYDGFRTEVKGDPALDRAVAQVSGLKLRHDLARLRRVYGARLSASANLTD